MRLPRKPQYVKVRLDADMAPEGPLRGGKWPHAERVLTYHYFGKRALKRGERVCVNEGEYEGCFGSVLRRSWRYSGYSYGVRRSRMERVTITVPVEKTAEFEVA